MACCHFCPIQSGDRVWSYITNAEKYLNSNSKLQFVLKGYCFCTIRSKDHQAEHWKKWWAPVLHTSFIQPYQHSRVQAAGGNWWKDRIKLSAIDKDGPDGSEGEMQKFVPHFSSYSLGSFPASLESESHHSPPHSSPAPAIWDSAPPTTYCIAKHSIEALKTWNATKSSETSRVLQIEKLFLFFPLMSLSRVEIKLRKNFNEPFTSLLCL